MVEFFKDFIAESKRVIWPDKKELVNLTLNVLGFSIIVGIIIYAMDFLVNGGINVLEKLVQSVF